jgi:hypothetical protein
LANALLSWTCPSILCGLVNALEKIGTLAFGTAQFKPLRRKLWGSKMLIQTGNWSEVWTALNTRRGK